MNELQHKVVSIIVLMVILNIYRKVFRPKTKDLERWKNIFSKFFYD